MAAAISESAHLDTVAWIRSQLPQGGLFRGQSWRISPEPFGLTQVQVKGLEALGHRLYRFLQACESLYRQSLNGKAPAWISAWLDAGKPEDILQISRAGHRAGEVPRVIRPDLVLTADGFALAEIDALPGGIGLTTWLQETYSKACDRPLIGGADGMRRGFQSVFPEGDVLLAEEGLDYLPEWQWLVGSDRVHRAETYRFTDRPVYRFFEAFDWPRLTGLRETYTPQTRMIPAIKTHLEEKLWLGLFWMPALRETWRRLLGHRYDVDLRRVIPEGWVVRPDPLPPQAVLPGLNVHTWEEVMQFSQRERQLVLKVSGFSPAAWGSRGVWVGSDLSGAAWAEVLREALAQCEVSPRLLQRFCPGKVVEHSYYDESSDSLRRMRGRVRLCPFYFVEESHVRLAAVMATICPEDKKLLHGMKDAIIVPCALAA